MKKITQIIALLTFSLVFTVTAFSQQNVPDTARLVLGHGYDLTGRYAHTSGIKWPVLDLDRLINDRRVIRDANYNEADFITAQGKNITEYTSDLVSKTGLNVSGGVNIFSFSSAFSNETSNRFSSESVTRSEYEFATASSFITKDAYFIRNQNLSSYISRDFVNDVNTMTPQEIISRYGTHVMLGALFGARLDHNMSVRRKTQTRSTTVASLATTSFDLRFRGSGGGTNYTRELENRYGSEYDISSIEVRTRAVGGNPEWGQSVHNNQDYNAWISSIDSRIVWSGYYPGTLVPLYEFIVEERFGTRTQEIRLALRILTHGPPDMVRINGGTFMMGSPESEAGRNADREGTQRRVTVSSFYMSKYQVTQAEYESVMGTNPSRFMGFNLPVEQVTWFNAVEYCNRLSQREGLTPAYTISGTTVTWNRNANGYRLPTEAEWEYACRAGTTTPFNTGNNITTDQANYDGNYPYNNNAKGTYRERTTAVGSFAPNQWGLYDMHGNVWEWCWDWYGTYPNGAQTDPVGAGSGTYRVLRGGSWDSNGQYLRSAGRNSNTPSNRNNNDGFRVIRP